MLKMITGTYNAETGTCQVNGKNGPETIRTRFPKVWKRRYPKEMDWNDTLFTVNKLGEIITRSHWNNCREDGHFTLDIGDTPFSEHDSDYLEHCRKYCWGKYYSLKNDERQGLAATMYLELARGLTIYLDHLDDTAYIPPKHARKTDADRRQTGWQYDSRLHMAQQKAERQRDIDQGLIDVDISFDPTSDTWEGRQREESNASKFAEGEPINWTCPRWKALRLEGFRGERTTYAGTASRSFDRMILGFWEQLQNMETRLTSFEADPHTVADAYEELTEILRWIPARIWGKAEWYTNRLLKETILPMVERLKTIIDNYQTPAEIEEPTEEELVEAISLILAKAKKQKRARIKAKLARMTPEQRKQRAYRKRTRSLLALRH